MIVQKYLEAFERLPGVISERKNKGILTALGYTSNLDLLCDFDTELLNQLLKKNMPECRLEDMKPAKLICTVEQLLETVVYYCLNGIGGEVDVQDPELVKDTFSFTYGIGGTAVQAAMALNQVGCPSLVHLTDDSTEVCDILNQENIYTVSQEGKLIHTNQVSATKEQEIHFILQFQKGTIVRTGKQEKEIPCSNRLILTKITVNETVPFSKSFFRWIEEHAERVHTNVLSSFNCIQNPNILQNHFDFLLPHVERYHENNPSGLVIFEEAHYHNSEIKKMCIENVYAAVDIVSMNEEEMAYTLKEICGYDVDKEDILSCISGAEYLRKEFGIHKGVIVHTKDYAMYVGEPLQVDIEIGLMYGNVMATAKAANGWYGTLEQMKEVMSYNLSAKGCEYCNLIREKHFNSDVILVPSKYIDTPKYTIGLGDSFIGGLQIGL